MRGHTPHRMALAHIYHHDQPQRLSGMKGKPVFPITSSRSTSVQYCVHAVGRQAGRWAQKDTHTHTHHDAHTAHPASCNTCTRLLTNATSLGQGHCHSCTPSGY